MTVREVMTPDPVILNASGAVIDAARAMREHNVGDVVVRRDGKLWGIVTDRDIVVRVLAEGRNAASTDLDSICSHQLWTISPEQPATDAVKMMRDQAVRRLPVLENGTVVGIISLGDLAVVLDANSALGKISAAPPNQ